jgi:hypothetical protein
LSVTREQAFLAQGRACPELVAGIWASRAKRRVFCDATIARLARFLTEFAKSRNASHIIDKKDREQAKLSACTLFPSAIEEWRAIRVIL